MPSLIARRPLVVSSLIGASILLSGCSINSNPFTSGENVSRVQEDLVHMFADQEPISGPISLSEAVARSLKYNLDHRLKLMEEAVAGRESDVADMNLLPQVVANAGYTARSNYDASVSKNMSTGSTGIEPTTSDDKSSGTADLGLSWNILDFGISYIRSKQQDDYLHIVEERRRQVVHNIVQDVRTAYWRAVAAERTLSRLEPLMDRVRNALANSERMERERVGPVLDALTYQRTLIQSLQQLEAIKVELEQARTELAILMNLSPGTSFSLAAAMQPTPTEPLILKTPTHELELTALFNRSELRSEAYQLRINANESRVALLQMLPSLSFDVGYNYSGNSFLMHQAWASGGAQVGWNLMQVFSGPANMRLAETKEELSEVRRLALSMAVISQTNIARIALSSTVYNFELSQKLASIEGRISNQRRAQQRANAGGSLEAIQAEMTSLLANLRRDMAYADMQGAYGRMFATIAADPLPDTINSHDIGAISQAISTRFAEWERGEILPPEIRQDLLAPAPTEQQAAATE